MEEVKVYKNKELINDDLSTLKLPKIRDEFIAKLENAIMFLGYRDLSLWHSEDKSNIDIRTFDGAWLTDISLRHDDNETLCFEPFGDFQVTPDMFPKMNIKLMNIGGDVGHLSKYRFLEPPEKRNLEMYRYIFSQRFAFLDYGKQKWWTNESGYGFNSVTEIVKEEKITKYIVPYLTSLKPGYRYDKALLDARINEELADKNSFLWQTIRHFHMALQLSLTYDYEWSCYIKEKPDSLGIRIPIHPSSSKEIFMMRNIPEGKKRKTAIVNFVKEHYRTINDFNNEERQILIQKHLRGDLKFNWRGLEVHVIPSPYDIRKTKTTKNILKL